MADEFLRSIRRQYLQGNLSIKDYLAQLRRYGVMIWDWLPHTAFVELPYTDQIAIFIQKWPIPQENYEEAASYAATSGTVRVGKEVRWEDTHPDAPGVGEVLMDDLASFAYTCVGQEETPWISREEQIAALTKDIWYLILILKHHGAL